jgi:ligand-binding SRPBCC domain-containing protein
MDTVTEGTEVLYYVRCAYAGTWAACIAECDTEWGVSFTDVDLDGPTPSRIRHHKTPRITTGPKHRRDTVTTTRPEGI